MQEGAIRDAEGGQGPRRGRGREGTGRLQDEMKRETDGEMRESRSTATATVTVTRTGPDGLCRRDEAADGETCVFYCKGREAKRKLLARGRGVWSQVDARMEADASDDAALEKSVTHLDVLACLVAS